jgi:hypothetical protein
MKRLICILFLFVAFNGFGQATMSVSDALQAVGSTNSTTLTSASFSVTTGDYLVAVVHGRVSSGTSAIPTLSGLNVSSWQQVTTVTYDNGTGGVRRLTAWVGIATSTSSSTLTATWAVSNHQRHMQIYKVAGAATTNNGLDGLAQSATNTGNGTSASITMAARTSNSAAFACFAVTQSTGTAPSIDAPYSQLYSAYGPVSAFAQPIAMVFAYENGGSDNTPSATLSATYDWAGIALEFKPPTTRRIISIN